MRELITFLFTMDRREVVDSTLYVGLVEYGNLQINRQMQKSILEESFLGTRELTKQER